MDNRLCIHNTTCRHSYRTFLIKHTKITISIAHIAGFLPTWKIGNHFIAIYIIFTRFSIAFLWPSSTCLKPSHPDGYIKHPNMHEEVTLAGTFVWVHLSMVRKAIKLYPRFVVALKIITTFANIQLLCTLLDTIRKHTVYNTVYTWIFQMIF